MARSLAAHSAHTSTSPECPQTGQIQNAFVLLNRQTSQPNLTVRMNSSRSQVQARQRPTESQQAVPLSSNSTGFITAAELLSRNTEQNSGTSGSESRNLQAIQRNTAFANNAVFSLSNAIVRPLRPPEMHPLNALAGRLESNISGNATLQTAFDLGSSSNNFTSPIELMQHSFFSSNPASNLEQIKRKHVYELWCNHCNVKVCMRAMKAILLTNIRIELYSTDTPPPTVNLAFDDYMTCNCNCKIRDVACTGCGNILGYHVIQPCAKCLDSKNNGHFWMYYSESVRSNYRIHPHNRQAIVWGNVDLIEAELVNSCQPNCYEKNHR